MPKRHIDSGNGSPSNAPPTTTVPPNQDNVLAIYHRLYARYGPQGWWPADDPFEVIVGAVLVQQTAWPNVEKALANLRAAGALSPEGMHRLSEEELAALVRPSGFFRGKARKLRAFLGLLYQRFGGDLDRMLATPGDVLRPLLLATHGIGPETADSILLYAANQPYFVIDAYARRIFSRIGIAPDRDRYDSWQRLFAEALPREPALFNEYHALIVEHGKRTCRTLPLCEGCPVLQMCAFGRLRVLAESSEADDASCGLATHVCVTQ